MGKTHVAAAFPSDYISQITTEEELEKAIEKLLEVRELTCFYVGSGDFGMLGAHYFDKFDNKKEFAFYYKKIQPYLSRLNSYYTPTFIDTLAKPQDYHSARKEIMTLGDKLQKLVCAERTPTSLSRPSQEAIAASKVQKRKVETFLAFQRNSAYRELFGGTNLQNTSFSRTYKKFCTVIAEAYENGAIKKQVDILERSSFDDPLLSYQEKIQNVYSKLYPVSFTSSLQTEFPNDFISRCNTEQELQTAISSLHEAYAIVVSQPGAYAQLRFMASLLDANKNYFNELPNRLAFIALYKKLQPYLAQLDEKYSTDEFIQALEEADLNLEPYESALRDITNLPDLEARLEALVREENRSPSTPKKIVQDPSIFSAPSQDQIAAIETIENSLNRISVKFRKLKASETAKNMAQIVSEKKTKANELANITNKISNLVKGLDQTKINSQTLQEMLDTHQKLTIELSEIQKRKKNTVNNATKELDTQAKALMAGLKNLPFNIDSITALRLTVTALEAQISRVGSNEPDQIRTALEIIRAEFRSHLQIAASHLELAEGLEKGSLAETVFSVNTLFENYYDYLITSFHPISYLQLASEKLYQIADQLQKRNDPNYIPQTAEIIQQKSQSLAQKLDDLPYYDPNMAKKVLETINQLQAQVTQVAMVSGKIVMNKLKEIRSELGVQLVTAADNADFHLGLKTEKLAKPISECFDNFYTDFITAIETTNDQTDLILLTDTTLTEKRLAKGQQRLAEIKSDQEAARIEALIFGPPHKDADTINFYFATLNREVLNAGASKTPLLAIKNKLQAYFTVLRPYLVEGQELADPCKIIFPYAKLKRPYRRQLITYKMYNNSLILIRVFTINFRILLGRLLKKMSLFLLLILKLAIEIENNFFVFLKNCPLILYASLIVIGLLRL